MDMEFMVGRESDSVASTNTLFPSSKYTNLKRRSLPCQMAGGSYSTTKPNLRRFSERGSFLAFRPSKPDIDLISDYIYPKSKKSNIGDQNEQQQGTSTSTSTTISVNPTSKLTLFKTTSNPAPGVSRLSSTDAKERSFEIEDPKIPSVGIVELASNNSSSPTTLESFSKSSNNNNINIRGGGCRKVRLKLHKYPGGSSSTGGVGKENKFIELQTIEPDTQVARTEIDQPISRTTTTSFINSEVPNPLPESSRRFSDILASYGYGTKSTTIIDRRKSTAEIKKPRPTNSGIICSIGDLKELKCLTSSAQEIQSHFPKENVNENLENNRSKSFDATFNRSSSHSKKGIGSSWFSRRHLPISFKLPIPLNSPSIPNSPGGPNHQHQQIQQQGPIMPILTVTNENSGHSEIIEVPSPPGSSSKSGTQDKTKVTWDKKNGSIVDASILGSLIEKHLIKRTDNSRRRATVAVSTLIPNGTKNTGRARSASASTLGIIPESIFESAKTVDLGHQTTTTSSTSRRISFQINESSSSLDERSNPASGSSGRKNSTHRTFASILRGESGESTSLSACTFSNPLSPTPTAPTTTTPTTIPYVIETIISPNGQTTPVLYPPSSFMSEPTYHGRICTEDEIQAESRRRKEYYKNMKNRNNNNNSLMNEDEVEYPQRGGRGNGFVSICSAFQVMFAFPDIFEPTHRNIKRLPVKTFRMKEVEPDGNVRPTI